MQIKNVITVLLQWIRLVFVKKEKKSPVNKWQGRVFVLTPRGRRELQDGGCRPPCRSVVLGRPKHRNIAHNAKTIGSVMGTFDNIKDLGIKDYVFLPFLTGRCHIFCPISGIQPYLIVKAKTLKGEVKG